MSVPTWMFRASGLLPFPAGFEYGFMPDDVMARLDDVLDGQSNPQDYEMVVEAWAEDVLVPLLTSTLVPALPAPVTFLPWDENDPGNPVRIATVGGLDATANPDACLQLLHPIALTVPVQFLVDASLGLTTPRLLAAVPLALINAASRAGLSASEIAARHRAGHLTEDAIADLHVLAALQT